MRNVLPCQLVQKPACSSYEISFELHEAAHYVVFRLVLGHNARAAHQENLFHPVQLLDKDFILHRVKRRNSDDLRTFVVHIDDFRPPLMTDSGGLFA